MGLLQVISSTDRRGAETFGVDLNAALQARGRATAVVALAPGRAGGLEVPCLGSRRFGGLSSLRRLASKSAVVVAHGSSTLPACTVALVGTGVPFVYRGIGSPLYWASTPLRRARVRFALGRAAQVVALWQGAASDLAEHFGVESTRIRVIPNGRPASVFAPITGGRRHDSRVSMGIRGDVAVAVYLGALSREKGVDVLIRALPDDVQLIVAGSGPDRTELEDLASVVAPGRVQFLGSTDDPVAVLAAADVVALPSRSEGLPAVAIEAGLCGLPVVATAVGGTGEIVVDGETGRLVPSDDSAALREALDRVVRDPGDLGARARVRCLERFELGVVVDLWEALLDEVAIGPW